MGQEIESSQFSEYDFRKFSQSLEQETRLLAELFRNNQFVNEGNIGGFELEAWLVSLSGAPTPINNTFLNRLKNPLVVHELAAFNVEINSDPVMLKQKALTGMEGQLQATWNACREVARELSTDMMMVGILPSIQQNQLSMANMSKLNRYKALNDQIIKLREGKPLTLDICGKETIRTTHQDVMLESACTSLQLHLQVPLEKAAQAYNASILLSAPIVAVTANSPYLFGHELWDETRIPLFEQSIELGSNDYRRVTFGNAYIKNSLFECYEENLKHYPVLVPFRVNSELNQLNHLRFHNGTIWRWNRPLIGFDENGAAHLRIEHRVIPSGPTVTDCIANAAFYFGLVNEFSNDIDSFIEQVSFQKAKNNFYTCAKYGFLANIEWSSRGHMAVKTLLLEELIPACRRGLLKLDIAEDDIDKYLSIIEQRIETEQNGTNWQRKWVGKHGRDMNRLSCSYLERQNSGVPVHEWTI